MVRLVPEQPTFTTASEQEVWARLRDGLGPEDVLLANLRLTDETKDHEADLVVLMPGVGVLVLEVKGGSVWHDEEGWWQRGRGQDRPIDPVQQVRTTKYALRTYAARDARWNNRNHVAWGHGVVTPYSDFPTDFATTDCPRWSLHDRHDQGDLAARVRENARRAQQGKPPPTFDDIEVIAEILAGRMRTSYDVNADSDERAAEADRLTPSGLRGHVPRVRQAVGRS